METIERDRHHPGSDSRCPIFTAPFSETHERTRPPRRSRLRRSRHPGDHLQRPALDHRRDLRRADEVGVLHQHQGAARPLHRDHGRARTARRAGGRRAAGPHRLDERTHRLPARQVRRRRPRGRPLHRQRPAYRGRHPSPRHQLRDAGVRRWRAVRLRREPRPPRGRRGHGPRLHGRRDERDLPGGPAHPGGQALPRRRAPARRPGPAAAQRAGARGAARGPLRADRGLPPRRPAPAGSGRALLRRRRPHRLRRDHRAHRAAAARRRRRGPGRRVPVRGRDGRRRGRDRRRPHPARGHHRGRPGALRLRRHQPAGQGQRERHHERDAGRGCATR